jgi:hypothetical protein
VAWFREAREDRPDLQPEELSYMVLQRIQRHMGDVYAAHSQEIDRFVVPNCSVCGGSGETIVSGGGAEWWRGYVLSEGDRDGRWRVWDMVVVPKDELPHTQWMWNPWKSMRLREGIPLFISNGTDRPVKFENGMALIWTTCDIAFPRLGNPLEKSAA